MSEKIEITMTQSQFNILSEIAIFSKEKNINISELSRKYNISRPTVNNAISKFMKGGKKNESYYKKY